MTWFLVIIAIVVFLFWSYNFDKKEIINKRANKLGDLNERYKTLINYFASNGTSIKKTVSIDKIIINKIEGDLDYQISLLELYDIYEIEIIVKADNLTIAKRKWQFPLYTNQDIALKRIKLETADLLKSEIDSSYIVTLKKENEEIKKKEKEEIEKKQQTFINTINSDYDFKTWKEEIFKYLDNCPSLSDLLIQKDYNNIYYGDLLKCFEWKFKRIQILLTENFTCRDCKTKSTLLHIHHEYYLQDKLPWDIELDALTPLCFNCHKKRHENKKIPVYKLNSTIKTLVSHETPYCSRCGGTGYLPQFSHVENGICFKCRGNLINASVFLKVLNFTYDNLNKYNDIEKRNSYRKTINSLSNYYLYCRVPEPENYEKEFEQEVYDDDLPF